MIVRNNSSLLKKQKHKSIIIMSVKTIKLSEMLKSLFEHINIQMTYHFKVLSIWVLICNLKNKMQLL